MSASVLARTSVDEAQLSEFCRKWDVVELAVFGSVLRDDFQAESDIDVLISFRTVGRWTLLDHVQMEQELTSLIGRDVDLVTRKSVEQSGNWLRRRSILSSAQSIYGESNGRLSP